MSIVLGIDEVGRGCWAGPLVAGAVILEEPIAGLKDSKKLTKTQREKLAFEINLHAKAVGLGWVQPGEIDSIGLTKAVGLAMQRALAKVTVPYDKLIIDGNINFFLNDSRARAIIKADNSVPSVSAASIVAKVARDKWMATNAAEQFPEYEFEKHVGYGTKLHLEMLQRHGVCVLHRLSYKPVKKIVLARL